MQRNIRSGPQGAPESTEMSKEDRPGRKSPVSMHRAEGSAQELLSQLSHGYLRYVDIMVVSWPL